MGFVSEEDSRQESSHPSRGWPTGRWRPRGVQMTSLRVTETRVGRRSVDYYGMREVTVWVIVYSILDSPPLILFLLYIFRFPLSQEIPQAQQWPIPSSSSTSTTTRTTTSTGSQRPSPFPRTSRSSVKSLVLTSGEQCLRKPQVRTDTHTYLYSRRTLLTAVGSYVKDVEAMGEFLLEQLTSLGVKAEKRAIGTHTLEGKEVDLPPVIIGQIGQDPKKVCGTVSLICLDVPPLFAPGIDSAQRVYKPFLCTTLSLTIS